MAGIHRAAAELAAGLMDSQAVVAAVVVAPSGCQISAVAVVDKGAVAAVVDRVALAVMTVVLPSVSFCQMLPTLRWKTFSFVLVMVAKVVKVVAADWAVLVVQAAELAVAAAAGWSVKVVLAALVVMAVQAAAESRVAAVGR